MAKVIHFLGGPDSKESACNAGDLGSVPGSGRSPGEGYGYPLQYSWPSLVAQAVKNPPAMPETWVQSLGWEDHLGEGMATHSRILAWRISMDRGAWWVTVHGVEEYWSELPFPSPGDLPNPGIEPRSPILQVDSLLPEPPGKPAREKQSYTRSSPKG